MRFKDNVVPGSVGSRQDLSVSSFCFSSTVLSVVTNRAYLWLDEGNFRSGVRILARPSQVLLEPRKSPVQARSAASVEAILEATIQVLLDVGKDRLTTARVARRAGVSVGTLYQYFPNKSALLQAALKRHLAEVTNAIELVCKEQKGRTLQQMASALITTFLHAKIRDAKTSVALYSISSDVDGAKIAQQMGNRFNKAIVRMLATASDPLTTDPQLVAFMLQGAMVGVTRRLLESSSPQAQFETSRRELIVLACAYLNASVTRPSVQDASA
jgi:AcrR family transcriptional regulator